MADPYKYTRFNVPKSKKGFVKHCALKRPSIPLVWTSKEGRGQDHNLNRSYLINECTNSIPPARFIPIFVNMEKFKGRGRSMCFYAFMDGWG